MSKLNPWTATAPDGQTAYCGKVEGYASLQFKVRCHPTTFVLLGP
jgi:predicted class III extradiol MEMO1 family dioxygenase